MAKLFDLPGELIAHIFRYLEDQDVFAARLANRFLENTSFSHFGTRFFRKTGYMITCHSLNILKSISAHKDLSKYPQHVWFNPDMFTYNATPECLVRRIPWSCQIHPKVVPCPAGSLSEEGTHSTQCEALRLYKQDHKNLLEGGELEAELRNILPWLPNLKTIGMRRGEEYNPRGWQKLREAVGRDPRLPGSGRHPGPGPSYPTKLFTAIIQAIASTDVQLRRLYTDLIEIDNIPSETLPSVTLRAACSSIHYLEINVTRGAPIPRLDQQDLHNKLRDSGEFGNGLVRLISAMPELKEVGLQIFPNLLWQGHAGGNWRDSYTFLAFSRLADKMPLRYVKRIKLESIIASDEAIRKFLLPCAPALESLKLRDIRLLAGASRIKSWQTVFAFLHLHCAALRYILFSHLQDDAGTISYATDAKDRTRLEETGAHNVRERLAEIIELHSCESVDNLDDEPRDEPWHTDTSDEDW